MNSRWFLPFLSVIFFGVEAFASDLKQGSSAVTLEAAQVVAGGKSIGTVEAGKTVSILGVQTSAGQAVISYQPVSGPKLVGLVPLDKLVAIDTGASTNSPTSAFVPDKAAPPPPPVAPPIDLNETVDALALAQNFKADKAAAKAKLEGQRIKFKGVIDKLDVDTGSSGGDMPILFLKTATGLPRIKVRLSNSPGTFDSYFRRYNPNIPHWWWGFSNRSMDFRLSSLNEIQVRMVYRYRGSIRDSTSWFTVFKTGEPVTIEATCKGLYMDIDFDNGQLFAQ